MPKTLISKKSWFERWSKEQQLKMLAGHGFDVQKPVYFQEDGLNLRLFQEPVAPHDEPRGEVAELEFADGERAVASAPVEQPKEPDEAPAPPVEQPAHGDLAEIPSA